MAVDRSTKSKRKFHFGWRALAVCFLLVLGMLSLAGFMMAHWTERQVLTTDNWVTMVSPLPKDDAVASALSTYSINTLLTNINLQDKISQALPDKAAFLAPSLTEQIQTRLTKRTKQIIQSDQFQFIWTSANRVASEKLLASARGTSPAPVGSGTKFNLDLASFKDKVSDVLGTTAAPVLGSGNAESSAGGHDVTLSVNLKTRLSNFKKFVKAIDFINGTLGLFALVCLLGAIVVARARRKVLLIISAAIVVLALLQLIGVKAVRPAILNAIQDSSFRPAAGFVYDSLLATFRRSSLIAFWIGIVIFLIGFFTQRTFLNRNKKIMQWQKDFDKSQWLQTIRSWRTTIRQYRFQIVAATALLWLVLMAFVFSLDWQGVVRALLFYLLAVEVIYLVAARPKEAPMQQKT